MSNQSNDFLKGMDKYLEKRDKDISHAFHGYIKESYLTKFCKEVIPSKDFQDILIRGVYNDSLTFGSITQVDFQYDIALNTAMSHWYYTIPIRHDEHAIALKYSDKDYHEKLFKNVIEQCSFRLLLTTSQQINTYDHVPIVFSMLCLTNELMKHLDRYQASHREHLIKNHVDLFSYNSLMQAAHTVSTIISTFESRDFNNAYALLRTLMEELFTFLDIRDNEKAIDTYYKFLEYKNNYSETNKFPPEFDDIAPKDKRLWGNYLNYGWLDSISDKKKNYVFKDIIECCPIEEIKNDSRWISMYKQLSRFAHGNLYVIRSSEEGICGVSLNLSHLLVNIAQYTSTFLDETFEYNGIDLVENLKTKIDELGEIMLTSKWFKY